MVVRQQRPKAGKSAPVAAGPFAVLDVLRQTGTVKVTAGPHSRFVFKHGPDLRLRAEPVARRGRRRLLQHRGCSASRPGPTGTTPVNAPCSRSRRGRWRVRYGWKPTYRLKTHRGRLGACPVEIEVKPVRTEVGELAIDVPAEWRGLESESEPEVVEGVSQGKEDGPWRPVTVRLAEAFKQPFKVMLVATVPVAPGAHDAAIPLPKFPKAVERDSTLTATVPEGLELHGTARPWDGDVPAAWSVPLGAVPGPDGKAPKAVAAVTGKGERGLARAALTWQAYRPDITADVRAEITVNERQVVVSQTVELRSADGFPKPVRFHGPAEAMGLKARPALDAPAAGVWSFAPPPDAKRATLTVSFALPLPHADGPLALPVGLLWPTDARVETTVRVWVSSATGRTVAASAAGWRELPPEPAERDALPALTLAASAEHPLVLEVRTATTGSAAAVWVERALIEAGMTEDGSVGYRARFRLRRWLVPAVEVLLPETVGPNPVARIDGVTAALVPIGESDSDGARRFRVSLPEGAQPTAPRCWKCSDALPGVRHGFGETVYQPPRIASAAYSGPTRWLITEPADAAPLQFSARARAEIRWRWRTVTYAPTGAGRAALDRWFVTGVEPGPSDAPPAGENEPLVLRQTAPDAVRVVRVPWLALVIGCSLAVFVLVVALTWLRTSAACLLVAIVGGVFGVCVVLYPQPAVQVVAAGQPGLALGLLAVGVQTVILWLVKRRVTHLPGFTRTLPEPRVVAGQSTATAAALPSSVSSGAEPTGQHRQRHAGRPGRASSGS